jgi:hypothetical protein
MHTYIYIYIHIPTSMFVYIYIYIYIFYYNLLIYTCLRSHSRLRSWCPAVQTVMVTLMVTPMATATLMLIVWKATYLYVLLYYINIYIYIYICIYIYIFLDSYIYIYIYIYIYVNCASGYILNKFAAYLTACPLNTVHCLCTRYANALATKLHGRAWELNCWMPRYPLLEKASEEYITI